MDDFYRYYAPDFNFLYPKSVFAYSEADDETNSYYLSSADGSMTLEFYEEDTSGSAKENVKKFYNKTQNEVHAIKYDPKWEDHQVIAGQYVANTNEAFYYFIITIIIRKTILWKPYIEAVLLVKLVSQEVSEILKTKERSNNYDENDNKNELFF